MITEKRRRGNRRWYKKYKKRIAEMYRNNKEVFAARQLRQQCKRVGITVEFYNSLPKVCNNPGCSDLKSKTLHKDHDHTTGRFRGLLCNNCNVALGLLGESRERVAGLLTYIEKYSV